MHLSGNRLSAVGGGPITYLMEIRTKMNTDISQRDTEELMEEVYFKDHCFKSRLAGLETSEDSMRELIEYNADRLKNMEREARWWRNVLLTCVLAIFGLQVTTILQLLQLLLD